LDTSGHSSSHTVLARLQSVDARRVATEKDFDSATGEIRKGASARGTSEKGSDSSVLVLDEAVAATLADWLAGRSASSGPAPEFRVSDVDTRKSSRKPAPPFITSSLQQAASRKHGMSPDRTMYVAQGLYEKGYITYMRTDSYTLSSAALEASRGMVSSLFGADYLSKETSGGKGKATPKNAQEAHEAIRPAEVNGKLALPEALELSHDEHKLYSLILRRTLAAVMAPSQSVTNTYTITASSAGAAPAAGKRATKRTAAVGQDVSGAEGPNDTFTEAVFKSSDTVTVFPGYLAAMTMSTGPGKKPSAAFLASASALLSKGQVLQLSARRTWEDASSGASTANSDEAEGAEHTPEPEVSEGEPGKAGNNNTFTDGLKSTRHTTRPPSRFTESSFVQELEELGVGRPSTYAATFRVLQERGYVVVDKQTIIPTVRGMVVSAFLEKHFPLLTNAQFTAEMEKNLDLIAQAACDPQDFLQQFYLADNPGEDAATAQARKQGLLPMVSAMFRNGGTNYSDARMLEVPWLSDLGVLSLYKDKIYFHEYGDSSNVTASDPSKSGDHQGTDSNGRPLSGRKWALPDAMRGDMRQITVEAIRDVMQTAPLGGSDTSLGQHSSNEAMYFKVGPYGPYLQVGAGRTFYKLPSWMDEAQLTAEEAIVYAAMPKDLGLHPVLNAAVQLKVKANGKLIACVVGYDGEAELPAGTRVREVTLATTLPLLPNAETMHAIKSGEVLGLWKGEPVRVMTGRFGPYVQWKDKNASLKKVEPTGVTLEAAIALLEAASTWRAGKRTSATKQTSAAKADSDNDTKSTPKRSKRAVTEAPGQELSARDVDGAGSGEKTGAIKKAKGAAKKNAEEDDKPTTVKAVGRKKAAKAKTAATQPN
jgi:DNA topoisomerase-1